MNTKETLIKARELLSKNGAWIQKSYARTSEGHLTTPSNPNAACFCALGALYKAIKGYVPGEYGNNWVDEHPTDINELAKLLLESTVPYARALNPNLYPKELVRFNDGPNRTQKTILSMFDNAIAKLSQENA